MREFIAGIVTLGTAVVAASVVYQIVKPGSQGPAVTGQVTGFGTSVVHDLFKG